MLKVATDKRGPWDSFAPKAYLEEYYLELSDENKRLLEFFAREHRNVPPDSVLLDFGSGPTVYSLISAANHVRMIHLADLLEVNLREVAKWLRGGGFDWTHYFEYALKAEGASADGREIVARVELLREKIRWIGKCNAFALPPLSAGGLCTYYVVASSFCAECIASDKRQWLEVLQNIFSLLREGGKGILIALESADSYVIKGQRWRALPVTVDDVYEGMVRVGFRQATISIERTRASGGQGYRGIVLASGWKGG